MVGSVHLIDRIVFSTHLICHALHWLPLIDSYLTRQVRNLLTKFKARYVCGSVYLNYWIKRLFSRQPQEFLHLDDMISHWIGSHLRIIYTRLIDLAYDIRLRAETLALERIWNYHSKQLRPHNIRRNSYLQGTKWVLKQSRCLSLSKYVIRCLLVCELSDEI